MLLTIWCILVSIGSLYFIGLPVSILLYRGDNYETRWILSPFIGLSAIILISQNLVYLGVPIGLSTPWIWAVACLLWVWVIKTRRLITLFSAIPYRILGSALAAYMVQGIGLLLVGAKYYVGRAWHDQFNYTAIAQFLTDYPFNLSFADIQTQPYLVAASTSLKFDRIGQSIFQGFLAVSTLTDAKTTFEPAILLAPLLIVLAIYCLTEKLSQARSSSGLFLLPMVAAGALPGIAMVHLESFFSQALAIPLLMLWPFIVSEAIEKPDSKRLFVASLLLAAGTSIYTEFYIIFVSTGTLIAVFEILRQHNPDCGQPGGMKFYIGVGFFRKLWRYFAPFGMVLGVALLINIGFAKVVVAIFHRISIPGILSGIYPWGIVEGLQRLWFGDMVIGLSPFLRGLLGIVSLGLMVTAYLGFVASFWKRKDGFTLTLLFLLVLPLAIMFRAGYKYQYYKLLLSISPLLPLGIALTGSELMRHFSLRRDFFKTLLSFTIIGLFCLSFYGTLDMTVRSGIGRTMEEIGRGGAHKLLSPSTRRIQDELSAICGEDVYIIYKDNFFNGNYINGWLAYFARKNRVWVANARIGDATIGKIIHPQKPIQQAFLLTSFDLKEHREKNIVSAEPYYLYKFSDTEWDTLSEILEPKVNASLVGFGSTDFLSLSESAGADGSKDAVFRITIHTLGRIESIEIGNISGMYSVWDTIPENGAVLLGVADIKKPNFLLNKQDGSIDIGIHREQSFLLYVADNGSIKGKKTCYQITVTYSDGKVIIVPVE